MYSSKFNESQRLAILAEQDGRENAEDICRGHQISPATGPRRPSTNGNKPYLINKTMTIGGLSS